MTKTHSFLHTEECKNDILKTVSSLLTEVCKNDILMTVSFLLTEVCKNDKLMTVSFLLTSVCKNETVFSCRHQKSLSWLSTSARKTYTVQGTGDHPRILCMIFKKQYSRN